MWVATPSPTTTTDDPVMFSANNVHAANNATSARGIVVHDGSNHKSMTSLLLNGSEVSFGENSVTAGSS
jgi:hypothetical protein